MRSGAPRNHADPVRRNSNMGFAAYLHAEHMLDRYGVAYVCRHPEILLGIVPQVEAEHGVGSNSSGYGPDVRAAYINPLNRGRAIEACRTLDEIFAPESIASGERRSPTPHSYGRFPEGPDGKPTRYGRWYC